MKLLKGARVLVTRPAHQAKNLCRLITDSGGSAVLFPALGIVAVNGRPGNARILANLNSFQWIVFISVNAVNFALKANGGKIVEIKPAQIAAMGCATAQALEAGGLPVDLIPANGYNSEALLAMPQFDIQRGQRCLIVRGQGGREELADALLKKGVEIEYLEVYKRIIPDIDSSPIESMLAANQLDFVTITSGEALQNLLIMIDRNFHQLLFALPLITVSDRVANIAAERGFKRVTVSDNPSDAAILTTITTLINGE